MSDDPQIPRAEFSPSWHEYFVRLEESRNAYKAAQEKIINVINSDIEQLKEDVKPEVVITEEGEEIEEDYQVGTIMMLVPDIGGTSTSVYGPNGTTSLTLTGDKLKPFVIAGFGGDATDGAITFRDTASLPASQTWKSLGTPTVDTAIFGHGYNPRIAMNFKRIS